MRVIAGSLRGRRLTPFTGQQIRPTPDRVREALFSILYSCAAPLSGGLVLDLFAGSGALGIEALSRGAERAWFVEHAAEAGRLLHDNLRRCGVEARARVVIADLWQALPGVAAHGPFAVIFADPPYGRDHGPRLLGEINRLGLLAGEGLLCLETAATDAVPESCGTLRLLDRRRYGQTMLHFYRHVTEETP